MFEDNDWIITAIDWKYCFVTVQNGDWTLPLKMGADGMIGLKVGDIFGSQNSE